jgi:hypothetical protein
MRWNSERSRILLRRVPVSCCKQRHQGDFYDSHGRLTTDGSGSSAAVRRPIGCQFAIIRLKSLKLTDWPPCPDLDFRSPRLFVDAPLTAGTGIALDRDQSNYLGNVLRLNAGDSVLVFNGRDGEWQATLAGRKRPDRAEIVSQTRLQDSCPTSTTCSRRSNMRGWITWRRRPLRWVHLRCAR